MAQFHTDEYVDFLARITPDNMDNFGREQAKCRSISIKVCLQPKIRADCSNARQSTSEMIVQSLTDCSNTALYQLVVLWVCPSCTIYATSCLTNSKLSPNRGCGTSVSRQMRHCRQLGRRSASRKEIRSQWFLLCER